jgi:carboxymethylenebutenolidase
MPDPKCRPRLTAADFDREVLRLFDQYVHGGIDRRGFLERASRHALAAGTTAAGLLAALSPDFAGAQKVPPTDARIKTESVEIESPAGYGKVRAYVVRPAKADKPLPVVLVVHENRGLNPHIEDIARRLALDNPIAAWRPLLVSAGRSFQASRTNAQALPAQLGAAVARGLRGRRAMGSHHRGRQWPPG